MNNFNTMKIKRKLALLVTIFVTFFVIFAAVAYTTLQTLKVNGPYYEEIILGKDLIADILPPPEYIIESHLTALLMADPKNRGKLDAYRDDVKRLKEEYDFRHDHWVEAFASWTEDRAETPKANELK